MSKKTETAAAAPADTEVTEVELAQLLYARAQTDYLRVIAESASIHIEKRNLVDEISEQLVVDLGHACPGIGRVLRAVKALPTEAAEG